MKKLLLILPLLALCVAATTFRDVGYKNRVFSGVQAMVESGTTCDTLPVTTSLFADYDVNQLSLNDGDLVSTLTDCGPNGYDLVSSGSARPYWTNSSSVNTNLPFLVFNAGADTNYMFTSAFTNATQPRTIYMVWKPKVETTAGFQCFFDSTNVAKAWLLYSTASEIRLYAGGSANYRAVMPSGIWRIWQINAVGNAVYIWTNFSGSAGSQIPYITSNGSIDTNSLDGFTLGASRGVYSGTGLPGRMDIARLVIFNAEHLQPFAASSNMWRYLSNKYSLYVP